MSDIKPVSDAQLVQGIDQLWGNLQTRTQAEYLFTLFRHSLATRPQIEPRSEDYEAADDYIRKLRAEVLGP